MNQITSPGLRAGLGDQVGRERRQELGDAGFEFRARAVNDDLRDGQPRSAHAADLLGESVDDLARQRLPFGSERDDAFHHAAPGERVAEGRKLGFRRDLGNVLEFQAEARVRAVDAEPRHGLVIGHVWQRPRELVVEDGLEDRGHRALGHLDHVLASARNSFRGRVV